MFQPEGIIPAIITPFDAHGQINERVLRRLVDRFIARNVQGLFCLGTNGEFFSLSFAEKRRVAEIVTEQANGRIRVYMGTGGICTHEVIQLSHEMEAVGVDALSVITPYFVPLNQQEVIHHYRLVAEATKLPIILYNIPDRTGIHLQPETVSALAELSNIVGIKDSSGSMENIEQYIAHTHSDFSVLCGTDSLILQTLMAGGNGAVAATANVVPEVVVAIYQCWQAGNLAEAEDHQLALHPLREAFQLATLPSVIKQAMNLLGLQAGLPRLPVLPVDEQTTVHLRKMLVQYKSALRIKGGKDDERTI